MEENQPIIWERGEHVQIFGKWLMQVALNVASSHWYLRPATHDYTLFEISNSIATDFKERTSLDLDTIAKSFNGITKGRFLSEFATIESLMLFVHRINELYDNAKEKENNQKDRPIVDKLKTATNEYSLVPKIPDMWKPTNFSPLYPLTPTGVNGITYRGDSTSQNYRWYLDILRERKKQQEKTNDSTITTTKKTKDYETKLQDKGTSLSRGNLSEGNQLRSRKNKARIVRGHLGDKTKDC